MIEIKPRYLPYRVNLTVWEGDTGDIVLEVGDIIDFTDKNCRMQVRNEDYDLIFEKSSEGDSPSIFMEPQSDDSTLVIIRMLISDTKGYNSEENTFAWELEIYNEDEVNTLLTGRFIIMKETVNYE
ncbi:MAG: hypothetical protein WC942_11320 [Clostridia bacterium]|jgi:hypothetical protein